MKKEDKENLEAIIFLVGLSFALGILIPTVVFTEEAIK